MFHLPREIIQLIFEFDPTYREEYSKSLEVLNKFTRYIGGKYPHFLYWRPKYYYYPEGPGYFRNSFLPSKLYFETLKKENNICSYARTRVFIWNLKIKEIELIL
jgi:hypothetical protein